MKKLKSFILLIPMVLLLLLCSCGHSKYYENGYKSGLSQGKSDVNSVTRITESSKHKYIGSSDFDAEDAYEMKKQTTVWGLDESHESEWRDGFIAGYNKGVSEQLGGKSDDSSNSDSSDSSSFFSKSSDETGISFWQWLLILIITGPIVYWLGGKAFSENKVEDGGDEKGDEGELKDNMPSENKDVKLILVNPWKSLLLIIFVFLFYSVMETEFDLRVNNWSTYILLMLSIVAMIIAYVNAKIWSNQKGSRFFCGIIRFLAVIFALLYAFCFCLYLYHWICD